MASETASAYVTLIPKIKGGQLRKEIEGLEGEAAPAAANVGNGVGVGVSAGMAAALKAGALVAGGAAVAGLAKAISGAGDLEQSIGAVGAVFKASEGQIHDWAKAASQSVGLSQNEYNEFATLLGTQLKNGLGGAAADMNKVGVETNRLVSLGADLASMFGGTTSEAVTAISSLLRGEQEPIRRYGVSLTQAAVDAKAASMGFTKVGNSMSQEGRQAATLALLMEKTADSHGNFGREAGTMQGQIQRIKSELSNMSDSIGMKVLPPVSKFLALINGGIQGLREWSPVIGTVLVPLAAFAAGFGAVAFIPKLLLAVKTGLTAAAVGVKAVTAAMMANPLGLIVGLIAALIAGLIYAYNTSETFRNTVNAAFGAILEALQPVIDWVTGTLWPGLQDIFAMITDAFQFMWGKIQAVWATIGPPLIAFIISAWDAFKAVWTAFWPVIQSYAEGVWNAIKIVIETVMGVIKGIIKVVTSIIKGDWQGVWDGIKQIVSSIWEGIKSLIQNGIDTVKNIINNVLSAISSLWNRAWDGIKSFLNTTWEGIKTGVSGGINAVLQFFRDLPGNVLSALGNIGSLLLDSGRWLVEGFLNGIKWAWDSLTGWLGSAVDGLVSSVTSALGIASPSKVFMRIGRFTGQGLQVGLEQSQSGIERAANSMIGSLTDTTAAGVRMSASFGNHAGVGQGASRNIIINQSIETATTPAASKLASEASAAARLWGMIA